MDKHTAGVLRRCARYGLGAVLLMVVGYVWAQAAVQIPDWYQQVYQQEAQLNEAEQKLSSSLRQVLHSMHDQGISSTLAMHDAQDMRDFSNMLVQVNSYGQVQVYVELHHMDEAVLELLESANANIDIINHDFAIIQAWVPFDRLGIVAAHSAVRQIRPPDYPVLNRGSVTSEGVAILRADAVHNTFGLLGNGVRVGLLSDGVNSLAQAQASGDLPNNVVVLNNNHGLSGSADEGTAMLEIVHDIAPGALLGFATGLPTSLRMIEHINLLAGGSFGAHIIVDDIIYPDQPAFEDGILAQTVNNVVASGVVYVTSAGNTATQHYTAAYREGERNLHDFGAAANGPSDTLLPLRLAANGQMRVTLQWNDRVGASANDYDLFLLNDSGQEVLAQSTNRQSGQGTPFETLVFVNNSNSSRDLNVAINRFSGAARQLKINIYGSGIELRNYRVANNSIAVGQASAAASIAVGAINARESGHSSIRPSSARGPAEIFFPQRQTRPKPDISGIAGNLISGAGGFGSTDPQGNRRFGGTSAAAPHIAGIAALLRQARPNASPAQIRNALQSSAVDLGTPGFDNTFGAGRANAFAAVRVLRPELTGIVAARGQNSPATQLQAPAGSEVVALQARFTIPSGLAAAQLEGISLQAQAVNTSPQDLREVALYLDSNGNGLIDPGEPRLASALVVNNQAQLSFAPLSLITNNPRRLLLSYRLREQQSQGQAAFAFASLLPLVCLLIARGYKRHLLHYFALLLSLMLLLGGCGASPSSPSPGGAGVSVRIQAVQARDTNNQAVFVGGLPLQASRVRVQ